MKFFLERLVVCFFISIGILTSIYLGSRYGFKGYFLGSLLGFGGCVVLANATSILISKVKRSGSTNKQIMGYHIRIIRGSRDEDSIISNHDFRRACDTMKGFSLNEVGNIAQYTDSKHGQFCVFWKNGDIWIKNPEEWAMPIIASLADSLNGRARGDELESYKNSGDSYIHDDDKECYDLWEVRRIRLIRKNKFWYYFRIVTIILIVIVILFRAFSR